MPILASTRQVIVRADPAKVHALLANPGRLLTTRALAPLLTRVGLAALQKVHEAFLVKARGQADQSGLRWRKLSQETIHRSPKRYKPVEVLRDKGSLERSLNPADPDGGHKVAPRRSLQVFRVRGRTVTVGTRRKWAWLQHHGAWPWLPRRRLWPLPRLWPRSWWAFVARHARASYIESALEFLKSTAAG